MNRGMTLVEIMVVVLILVLLMSIAYPAVTTIINKGYETTTIANMKAMTNATISWAADHGDKLPSPQYKGGTDLPDYWDLVGGSGLWLDGVIFAQVYIGNDDPDKEQAAFQSFKSKGGTGQAEQGDHLVGTIFENMASVKRRPQDRNWYHHSYAMNANLKPDEISKGDFMTEKSRGKFIAPSAMLYIDCEDQNTVMAGDVQKIRDAGEIRYEEDRVIAAFLDGNVSKLAGSEIPNNDNSTREGSLFWRGVQLEK